MRLKKDFLKKKNQLGINLPLKLKAISPGA